MLKNDLKVAMVIDDEYLLNWQIELIHQLGAKTHLSHVFFREVAKQKQYLNRSQQYLAKLDEKVYRYANHALSLQSCINSLPAETILMNLNGVVEIAPSASLAFDIIINLSAIKQLPDYLYQVSRLGVWHYFYSSHREITAIEAGLLEFLADKDRVFSGVEIRKNNKTSQCIYIATSSTHQSSINLTVAPLLWRMSYFIPELIDTLSHYPKSAHQKILTKLIEKAQPLLSQRQQEVLIKPRFLWLRLWKAFFSKLLRKVIQKLRYKEQWSLLITKDSNPLKVINKLERFEKIPPPAGVIWADPFLLEHNKRQYIFIEEIAKGKKKGHLSCMEILGDGSYSSPVKILERPYHLSYPFIFQYNKQYYIVPETGENSQIELYRCKNFPYEWEFDRVLMHNVMAYDTTLFAYNGLWWMLTSLRHHQACNPNEELYAFYADHPLSQDWQAHPLNPIVTDVARTRPAGRVFMQQGKLYRPSQNCAGSYGLGLNINEITCLSTEDYQELCISSCVPNGRYHLGGVHTMNFQQDIVVMDGIYLHQKWRMLFA